MRKTLLTKLALLLVMLVGAGSASAATTYKLTQVTSVEAGGLYVFEQKGHVMDNSVSSSALQTTDSYETTGLDGTESYVWTLETATNGFYMKNVSKSSNQYLNNGSKTDVSFGNQSSIWAFNFQTDNTVIIQNTSNSDRFLGYTTATTYTYKAYATSNLENANYPHAIKVYKLVEETGGGDPTPITVAVPTFSPVAGEVEAGTEVTISAATGCTLVYTIDGTDPASSNTAEMSSGNTATVTVNEPLTIRAIALDGDANESDEASAAYTIKAAVVPVSGLAIDFESELASYTDWEFENVAIHTTTISAHGGDSYGSNANTSGNATTTCVITTKNTVANPDAITFYISKESKNTTASSWYVEVSENGNSWIQLGDAQDAKSMDKGSWIEVTRNLSSYTNVYVRIRYNGSNASRAIDDITITTVTPKNVATPTFSIAAGTYDEVQSVELSCETDGATIYYTTDGTEPTDASTEYTTAISVGETMTIKAIAYKNNEASNVATATYTINLPLTTIAAVKALASGATFKLNLTGAQVVYIDGEKKNIYVRDASGAIDLYNGGGFTTALQTGDILSGTIEGTYSPYKNLPEIKDITDISVLTATNNQTVLAKTIAGTTEAIAANLCDLVKIENTEITESSGKYYVGTNSDIQLYDNFSVGYTVNTDEAVDVSGIATVYNTTYELFPRFVEDIVYLDNSVAVSIGEAGMATFSSTKALDFTGVDAIAAYTAKATSDGKITFTRIYKVPANTGLLLRNALGEAEGAVAAVNVPVATVATAVSDNNLIAVDTEIASLPSTDGTKANYILNKVNGNLGFYRAADKKVAAGKAYLQIDTSEARSFFAISFDDEATGISSVKVSQSAGQVYDLQGRHVAQPTKGLYIVNGKKVIIK